MTAKGKSLFTAVAISLLVAACSQPVVTQPPQPAPPPVTEPAPNPVPEAPVYPYTAPFTGKGTMEQLTNRPVMVMMNNHPKARPQSGLDKADIVYEVLAEGEVTRFLALYHSQKPDVIGPVRSIRPYFIEIGTGYDAVLVHAGGSPEALETLAHSDFAYINEIVNSAYFWREKFRKAPHNLYTDLDRIAKAMTDKGMRMTGELPYYPFLPEDAVIMEGEKAEKIDVTFHPSYRVAYQYDAEKKQYLRFTDGTPHKDLTTDQQLAATNLLVIATPHRVLDNEGRRDVDVTGPHDGILFQQGKARKVKWKRSGGVIRAYADEALTQELPLLPGNTWINIIPKSPGLAAAVHYQ